MSINALRPSAGLDTQALITAIKSANTLVLHAAVYSNFIHSEVGKFIRTKLVDGSLQHLEIIELQPNRHWRDEFISILRPQMTRESVLSMFSNSSRWSKSLAFEFPQQVNQVFTQTLPLQPVLIIGDTIFVGQYAHSSLTSAQGMWIQIECLSLGLKPGDLQTWYQHGLPSDLSGDWPLAISRYVEECRQSKLLSIHKTRSMTPIIKEEHQ